MPENIKDISILIVDDNSVNRQVLKFAVMKYGSRIDLAVNGSEALEKYERKPYDLILMDVMMPVMDGLEATKRIRNYEKENALRKSLIVAVSANFQDEDYNEYIASGFDEIFKKPVDFIALENFLAKYFIMK